MAMRSIAQKILSREQGEGRGARVRRSIGTPMLRYLDPFLMLDEFRGRLPGGFPDHPHRGFETVSYLISGSFYHEDFCGHKGKLEAGDLQWMTAGRGIMHGEMPGSSTEDSHGLQLWVNLKATDKMCEPAYQELSDAQIPKPEQNGVKIAVIAGTAFGVTSPVRTRTPTMYLSVEMQPNSTLVQDVPARFNGFAYVLSGEAAFGEPATQSTAHHTLVFSPGEKLKVQTGDSACRFVIIAGEPIGEPVAQHGPFVMNTREEIAQAFEDFHSGQNGFERAVGWQSGISKHRFW